MIYDLWFMILMDRNREKYTALKYTALKYIKWMIYRIMIYDLWFMIYDIDE